MSKVLLIYTGGTIGMVENPVTGAHEPLDFNHLACHVPELSQLKVDITTLQLDPPIDSSNMNPELWKHLVHIIADHYESFDGFVILHGTDTMAYTASALSYMLQNIAKPVILTGSQLPIGVLRTDGKENLITKRKNEKIEFRKFGRADPEAFREQAIRNHVKFYGCFNTQDQRE